MMSGTTSLPSTPARCSARIVAMNVSDERVSCRIFTISSMNSSSRELLCCELRAQLSQGVQGQVGEGGGAWACSRPIRAPQISRAHKIRLFIVSISLSLFGIILVSRRMGREESAEIPADAVEEFR